MVRLSGSLQSWPTPYATRPEFTTDSTADRGPVEAYPTYETAAFHSCTDPEFRTVIFCRIGPWSAGVPPIPDASGQIPVGSVTNYQNGSFSYWTLVNGKWLTLSHGIEADPRPQEAIIQDDTPTPPAGDGIIFFKRCIRKNSP